jgi:sulfite exporter TauE/SafE
LTKRQVNEDWMVTYRGWVYGVGFGAQLGLGFITLVACAAIYAAFAMEFLSGSVGAGIAIGAIFGATKAASLLPAGRARDRHSLVSLHRRLLAVEPLSVGAVVVAEVAAAAIVVGALG